MTVRILIWTLVGVCKAYSLLGSPRFSTHAKVRHERLPRMFAEEQNSTSSALVVQNASVIMDEPPVSEDQFRFGDPHNSGRLAVDIPGPGKPGIFLKARENAMKARGAGAAGRGESERPAKRAAKRLKTHNRWLPSNEDAQSFRDGTGRVDTVYWGCTVIPAEWERRSLEGGEEEMEEEEAETQAVPALQAAPQAEPQAEPQAGLQAELQGVPQAAPQAAPQAVQQAAPQAAPRAAQGETGLEKDTAQDGSPAVLQTEVPEVASLSDADDASEEPEKIEGALVKAPAPRAHVGQSRWLPTVAEEYDFRHGDPHSTGRPTVGLP